MKNTSKFIVDVFFTILVAGLLSGALTLLLVFMSGNIGTFNQTVGSINAIGSAIFGMIIGYKLNTLIRQHKKS